MEMENESEAIVKMQAENQRNAYKSEEFSKFNTEACGQNQAKDAQRNAQVDNNNNEHFEPTVRLLKITKTNANDACGFHLTRSKWDPYPWVSAVDADTPAEMSGLKAGDCVLEVNGEDVLGLRITDIAKLVKGKSGHVTLLLWSTGWNVKCDPENICCGPMPRTLQRLSIIVQTILSIIECPVCLDTIPPPAMQCQNGHLLCVNCRIRAEKCPVCRDRYTPRRALIAEQIYTAITTAFNLCRNEDKLRQKLFGPNAAMQQKPSIEIIPTMGNRRKETKKQRQQRQSQQVNKSKVRRGGVGMEEDGTTLPRNKFLAKLLLGKAYSMENLTNNAATFMESPTTAVANDVGDDGISMVVVDTPTPLTLSSSSAAVATVMNDLTTLPTSTSTPPLQSSKDVNVLSAANSNSNSNNNTIQQQQLQSCSNPFHNMINAENHLTSIDNAPMNACTATAASKANNEETPSTTMSTTNSILTMPTTTATTITNNVAQVNAMSKHFSISTNDLSQQPHKQQLQQKSILAAAPLNEHCTRNTTNTNTTTSTAANIMLQPRPNNNIATNVTTSAAAKFETKSAKAATLLTTSLLYLDKRRPCIPLSNSIECIRKRFQSTDVDDDDSKSITTHSKLLPCTPSNTSSSSSSSDSSGIFTSIDDSISSISSSSGSSCAISTAAAAAAATPAASSTNSSSTSSSIQLNISKKEEVEEEGEKVPVVVVTSSSPGVTLELSSSSSQSSATSVIEHRSQLLDFSPSHENRNHNRCRYRCPCDNCGKSFNASAHLQRHVKVVHRLPILSFGGASARLELPLRQPVDNAVLILEMIDNSNNNHNDEGEGGGNTNDACRQAENTDVYNNDDYSENVERENDEAKAIAAADADAVTADESVKSDDKASWRDSHSSNKECWIRIKMQGQDCIQAYAFLQATADESS